MAKKENPGGDAGGELPKKKPTGGVKKPAAGGDAPKKKEPGPGDAPKKKREPLPLKPPPPPSKAPLVMGLLVVAAAAGGAGYYFTHRAPPPPLPVPGQGGEDPKAPPPPAPGPTAPPVEPRKDPPKTDPEKDWADLQASLGGAANEDAKGDLVDAFLKANPTNPHAEDARGVLAGLAGRGWYGEKLPKGLKKGKERPAYVFDTGKGVELEVVYVPPGEFTMGSNDPANACEDEKPQHKRPMPDPYWIGRTAVTWKQYLAYVEAAKATAPPRPPEFSDDHGAINLSWHDGKAFCEWAGVALPTEAEWEKAARGTDGRRYPWGDDWDVAKGGPRRLLKSRDAALPKLEEPAGTRPQGASPYGALDMVGYIWEWCEDGYDADAYKRAVQQKDYTTPKDSKTRVHKGSRWYDADPLCRASARGESAPEFHDIAEGFRIVVRAPETK